MRWLQAGGRRSGEDPSAPIVVATADTVYDCPSCEAHYLDKCCSDCNAFLRRLGATAMAALRRDRRHLGHPSYRLARPEAQRSYGPSTMTVTVRAHDSHGGHEDILRPPEHPHITLTGPARRQPGSFIRKGAS